MTEKNTSSMEAALAAAEAAASATPETPAVIDHATPAAATAAPAAAMSIDQFMRETPQVDAYAKLKVTGYTIRDAKVTQDTIKATMVINDQVPCRRLRYGQPPATQYRTSYDGVRADNGELWSQVIANAERVTGAKVRDYPSMNVQIRLLEDAGGAKAGDVIGFQTTSTQNKNLTALFKTAQAAGLGYDDEFEFELGYEERDTAKGHWAVQTYKFVGEYEEGP